MHGFQGACVVVGACMVKGGVHGERACVWQRGACMVNGGGMHGI